MQPPFIVRLPISDTLTIHLNLNLPTFSKPVQLSEHLTTQLDTEDGEVLALQQVYKDQWQLIYKT